MNRDVLEQIKNDLGYQSIEKKPNKKSPMLGVKVDDKIAYVSGSVAFSNGEVMYKGRIGDTVTIEEGKKSAALAMINCLDTLDNEVGLENVDTILKVSGFLCCTEDIEEHPVIMNAASDVVGAVFGEQGKHARVALGIHTLPLGASVEIEFTAKLK